MNLIEAINVGMRAIGHTNIVDEQTQNPSAGLIKSIIENKRKNLLTLGWWFNTTYQKLRVPDTGEVTIPYQSLAIYSVGFYNENRYGIKDNLLYDIFLRTTKFPVNKELDLKFILDIEFQYLPEYAATYVAYSAAAEVYANDLGVDNNVQFYEQKSMEAFQLLSVEDTRQRKKGATKTHSYNRMMHRLNM